MKRIIFIGLNLLIGIVNVVSQEPRFAMGLLNDEISKRKMEEVPAVPTLLTRSFEILPRAYSLMQYAPQTGDQKQYGTCTSWSVGYCALTIAEAVKNNWAGEEKITSEAMSPIFLYSQAKTHRGCDKGICMPDVLQTLVKTGTPKFTEYNYLCDGDVRLATSLFASAKNHRIENFRAIRNPLMSPERSLKNVKKALTENRPVIICMNLPNSFLSNDVKDLWQPKGANDAVCGYHAMCIIGYDDDKYGGAFLIQNSWGRNWGNNGRTWIKYADFLKYVDFAYEMYLPRLQPINTYNIFSGSINIQLSNGEKMKFYRRKINGFSVFESKDSYMSGTRYRIYLSNNKPAYVYVIASDATNNVSRVFPPNDGISASLSYKSNDIALPDEKYFIEMDKTIGKDNLCVIFSKKSLDIKQIISDVQATRGSFQQKVAEVLGRQAIAEPEFDSSKIDFTIKTTKTIVPIFIDINHK